MLLLPFIFSKPYAPLPADRSWYTTESLNIDFLDHNALTDENLLSSKLFEVMDSEILSLDVQLKEYQQNY